MQRKISLKWATFILFMLLSIGPLLALSFICLDTISEQTVKIEQEYEKLLLEQKLSPIETRIKIYKELIGFVSQLPAVVEILDKGEAREGSIDKAKAYKRYNGVINRAFNKYPEIINISIYDQSGNELLHIKKDTLHIKKDTSLTFQVDLKPTQRFEKDLDSFKQTLELPRLDTIIIPTIVEEYVQDADCAHHLILHIYTPIRYQDKNIGIYRSSIDVSILSQSYPELHWVFSDGSYLSKKGLVGSAFEQFSGLEKVFESGGDSGLTGKSNKYSWVSVFKDEKSNISLWAGKEIQLDNAERARELIYKKIAVTTVVAVVIILLLAYFTSKKLNHFLTKGLSWLKAAVLNEQQVAGVDKVGIIELDNLIEQIDLLIEDHEKAVLKLKQNQRELQTYNELKTTLLQEVNHRVKNNLVAIISMIHVAEDQYRHQLNEDTLEPLKILENRVKGLLTVHSLLSSSEWEPLNLSRLCQKVVAQSLKGLLRANSFELQVSSSSFMVESDTAHHLTLVMNELATNTVKHRKNHDQVVNVEVEFHRRDDSILITYKDNGPGFPESVLAGELKEESIGLEMLNSLMRNNLEGGIKRYNENGAVSELTIPTKYGTQLG